MFDVKAQLATASSHLSPLNNPSQNTYNYRAKCSMRFSNRPIIWIKCPNRPVVQLNVFNRFTLVGVNLNTILN